MNPQQKIDEVIQEHLKYCCWMENKYEGITAYALKNTNIKKLIIKLDDHYHNMRLADFILVMNNMRDEWGEALNKFTQVEMEI